MSPAVTKLLGNLEIPYTENVRPDLGGDPAAREPGLGTGRGGDVTGNANSFPFSAPKRSPAQQVVRQVEPKYSDLIAPDASRSDSQSVPTTGSAVPDYRE